MVKSRQFVLVKEYDGEPKETDVEITEEELRPIKDGEYLTKALFLSVDPYMRIYGLPQKGEVLLGTQVARVIESKNKDFPVGANVVGYFGLRTHTIVPPDFKLVVPPYILPDIGNLPLSLGFGVLGMPGNTAYFAIEENLKPKAGETILISGAAGAVGTHVGEIAKLKGCKVIGLAGTDAKVDWLVKERGFDHAFNYKTVNLDKALSEFVPQGLDMYFDNVGDKTIDTVHKHINGHGRIVICGAISKYNSKENEKVDPYIYIVLWKSLQICGFGVYDHLARWQEGIKQNLKWIQEGKLHYREHITEGFDNTFKAFIGVLRGENTGKGVVKV